MPSATAKWRSKMKEQDPERYGAYLKSEAERNKRLRAEKKRNWETEFHTRAMVQEHEKKLERAR